MIMSRKTVVALLTTFLIGLTGCAGRETGNKIEGENNLPAVAESVDRVEEGNENMDLDTTFNTYMEARFSEDGKTGYIPVGDGTCIQIHEEEGITFAAISPDRRSVVVLLKSDELYVTDMQQKNRQVISNNCASGRVYPRNEGVVFQEEMDGEKHFLRYTFDDSRLIDMGACSKGIIADDSVAMAGVNNEDLCVLTPDSDEFSRYPGLGSGEINITGISGDGNTVVWTKETNQNLTKQLYTLGTDGTGQLLGDIEVRGLLFTNFSKDNNLTLVTSEEVNHLYLKDASGQWKQVELPGDLKNETGVYGTDAGLLHQVNADEIHYIYLRCGNQLCAVSPEGTVTVIRDSVRDFDILNGMLYYSDGGKNVFSSRLDGTEVSEETQLLQGVDSFAVSESGNYLYSFYVHADDEKVRSLSIYPLHDETPSETILSESIYADSHVYLDAENDSVFYVENIREAGDSSNYMGTFKAYHADREETEIIDEDVYKNTFVNGKDYVLVSEYAQSMAGTGKFVSFHGNLMYRKKPESNTDGYRFDWYYYDGSESVLMASDLDY